MKDNRLDMSIDLAPLFRPVSTDFFRSTTSFSSLGLDSITDFQADVDKIQLQAATFVGLTTGNISFASFTSDLAADLLSGLGKLPIWPVLPPLSVSKLWWQWVAMAASKP